MPSASPRVIVLRAPGTNCDEETAAAWQLVGARVETWHVGRLLEDAHALDGFEILTIPGGFSYGDDLGAGRILATRLGHALGDALRRFHDRGGLILGICNGFQVLVRCGLLPGSASRSAATLAHNDCGRFEARWIKLAPRPGLSPFVSFSEPIELPVAHGEGKFLMADQKALESARRHWSDRPEVRQSRRATNPGLSRQPQRLGARGRGRVRPVRPDLRTDAASGAVRERRSASALDENGKAAG